MTLPKHAEELCFSTEVFLEESFTVDDFVNQCRKRVTIECLRDDLDAYYRTLKSAMVELINKDYADFVNLSANLVRVRGGRQTIVVLYNAHLARVRACLRKKWVILSEGLDIRDYASVTSKAV